MKSGLIVRFNLDVYDGVEINDRRPFTLNGPVF